MKKKLLFIKKKKKFEGYFRRKISDAKFYIHRQHRYKFTYTSDISDSGRQTNLT